MSKMRIRASRAFGACAFLGSLLACQAGLEPTNPLDSEAPPQVQTPGTVRGRVILELDSDAPGDTLITLAGPQTVTGPVGVDGSFELTGVTPGEYSLAALRPGYLREELIGLRVPAGSTVSAGDLRLSRARGTFEGQILLEGDDGSSDGAGATVTLRSAGPEVAASQGSLSRALRPAQEPPPPEPATEIFTVTTDAEGRFVVSSIPVGTWLVVATRSGFAPYCAGFWTVEQQAPGRAGGRTEITGLTLVPLSALLVIRGPEGEPLASVPGPEGVGRVAVTRSRDLSILIQAAGATRMRLGTSPEALGALPFVPFAVSATLGGEAGLPEADGSYKVYAQFVDQCESTSPVYSQSVILDRTPPRVAGVRIDGGASWLRDAGGQGTVEIVASDGEGSGLFRQRVWINDVEITTPEGRPFIASSVEGFGAEEGEKSVAIEVIDVAGNVSERVRATIGLDHSAPQLGDPALSVLGAGEGGPEQGNVVRSPSMRVRIHLAEGSERPFEHVLRSDDNTEAGPWVAFSDEVAVELPEPAADGEYSLFAQVRDRAGNTSPRVSVTVRLDRSGDLRGVVQREDGSAAAGVTVVAEAEGQDPTSAITGADGRYVLAGLRPGLWELVAQAEGFRASPIEAEVAAGATGVAQALVLRRLRGGLAGTARRLGAGGAADIRIVATDADGVAQTTFTDAAGAWAFAGVAVGGAQIVASSLGFEDASGSASVREGEVTQAGALELAFVPGSVSGAVRLEGIEDPSAARVRVSREGATDQPVAADGSFTIGGLPQGSYQITASAPDFADAGASATVVAGEDTAIGTLTLALVRGGVRGTTTPGGATVELRGQSRAGATVARSTVSSDDGAWRIDEVPVGDGFTLRFSAAALRAVERGGVSVAAGAFTVVDQSLEPDPGRIEGVVALEGGVVPSSLNITVSPAAGSVVLGEGGAFTISGLPQRSYTVGASHVGYESGGVSVAVLAGQTSEAPSITLRRRRGAVRGAVLLEGEASSRGILINLSGSDHRDLTVTDSTGAFRFNDVPVGTGYRVEASFEGFTSARSALFEVRADQTAEILPFSLAPQRGDFSFRECPGTGTELEVINAAYYETHAQPLEEGVLLPIALDLSGLDGDSLRISEDPGFAGASPLEFTTFPCFDLSYDDSGEGPAEGTRTVYLEITEGESVRVLRGQIDVDTEPPQLLSVQIQAGAAFVGPLESGELTVNLDFDDLGSGVRGMLVMPGPAPEQCPEDPSAYRLASAAARALVIDDVTDPALQGHPGVWACVVDGAGNVSEVGGDTVGYDAFAPAIDEVRILGGEGGWLTGVAVTVRVQVDERFALCEGERCEAEGPARLTGVSVTDAATECDAVAYRSARPIEDGVIELAHLLTPTDGEKQVFVCVRDEAGKTRGPVASGNAPAPVLDRTPPQNGAVALRCGGAPCASRVNTRAIEAQLSAVGVARARLEGAGLAAPVDVDAFVDGAAVASLELSAGDGFKSFEVRYFDAAGNAATPILAGVEVDSTLPGGEIEIVGFLGDGASSALLSATTSVRLLIQTLGEPVQMKLGSGAVASDCANPAGYVALQSRVEPFVLQAAGGEATAWLCLKDAAGNVTESALSDTIAIDAVAPDCSFELVGSTVDGEEHHSRSATTLVNAVVECDERPAQMAIVAGSLSCAQANWVAFADESDVQLAATEGVPQVARLCARDAARNVVGPLESAPLILDRSGPGALQVQLNGGRPWWNAADSEGGEVFEVPLLVGANEAGRAQISLTPDFEVAVSFDVAAGAPAAGTIGIASEEGIVQSVYVRVIDELGNPSVTVQRGITVDTEAPQGSLLLTGVLGDGEPSTAWTADLAANRLQIFDEGASSMKVSGSAQPDCSGGGYEPLRRVIDPFVLGGAGATRTAWVCLRDAAGNATAAPLSDEIGFDAAAPSCSVTISGVTLEGEPHFTKAATTTVDVVVDCGGEQPLMALAAGSLSCADAPYGGFLAETSAQILPGDGGGKTLTACFRDRARNVSAPVVSNALELDTRGPGHLSLSLHDGDGWWNASDSSEGSDFEVPVTFSADESGTYELSLDPGFREVVAEAYDADDPLIVPFEIDAVEGVAQTIWFRILDELGNPSSVRSASIVVDTVRPTGELRLLGALADGSPSAAWTTDLASNQLEVLASGATRMLLSGSVAPDCAQLGSYVALSPLVDPFSLGGAGAVRSAYACLADAAGNHTLAAISDSIRHDAAAPVCSITIAGRTVAQAPHASRTAGTTVDVSVSCDDASGVSMALSGSGALDCAGAAYVAFAASATAQIAAVPGPGRTISACFRDAALNAGAPVTSNALVLDTTAPVVPSITLHDGDGWWNAADSEDGTELGVPLTFTANEDVSFAAATNDDFVDPVTGAASAGVQGGAIVTIAATEGEAQTVWFYAEDAVGNRSAVLSASITVDTEPPAGGLQLTGVLGDGEPSTTWTTDLAQNRLEIFTVDATRMKVSGSSAPNCAAPGGWEALSRLVDPFALGGAGGIRSAFACLADAAGNFTAAPLQDSLRYDPSAPSCSVTITGRKVDGTAHATRSARATVDVAIACAGGETPRMALGATDFDCETAPYGSFQAATTATLAGTDGAGKTIFACFRDSALNVSDSIESNALTLDTAPPSVSVFTLHDGDGWWNAADSDGGADLSVPVSFTGTEGGSFELALSPDFEDAVGGAFVGGAPAASSIEILDREGATQAVYLRLVDEVGNAGVTAQREVVLDLTPPTGEALLTGVLADGSDSTVVTTDLADNRLQILADGAAWMKLSGAAVPDCEDPAGYEAFSSVMDPFALGGAGPTRRAYVCLADAAGNPAELFSDSIFYDSAGPSGCTLTLVGRKRDGSVSPPLTLTRTATPQVGYVVGGCNETPHLMALAADDIDCASASFGAYQAIGATLLSDGDGSGKTIRACFKDRALNVSGSVSSAAMELDTTGPAAVLLELNAGSSFPDYWNAADSSDGAVLDVPATISADEAGTFYIATGANLQGGGTGAYAGGEQIVSARIGDLEGAAQTVYLRIVDALGNPSLIASDTITLDTEAPVVSRVELDAGEQFTASVSVSLFSSVSGAEAMSFSLNGGAFSSFQPFGLYTIFLLDGSLGDGAQSVAVRYRDVAGNVSAGTDSDSIVLDRTPPEAPVIANATGVVDLGDPENVSVTLSSAGADNLGSLAGGTLFYQVKGGATWPAWTTLTDGGGAALLPPFVFELRPDAENRLQVRLVDGAGNVSAEDFVAVTEDSTAPRAPGAVLARDGDQRVLVSWDDSRSEDVVGYYLHYGPTSEFDGDFANEGASPIFVGDVNEFRLTGVPNGSPIFVAVQAVDRVPHLSALSNQDRADPNATTPEPVGGFAGEAREVAVTADAGFVVTDSALLAYGMDDGSKSFFGAVGGGNPEFSHHYLDGRGASVTTYDRGDGNGLVAAVGQVGRVDFVLAYEADPRRRRLGTVALGYDQAGIRTVRCGEEDLLYVLAGPLPDDAAFTASAELFELRIGDGGQPYVAASLDLSETFGGLVSDLACYAGDGGSDDDQVLFVLGTANGGAETLLATVTAGGGSLALADTDQVSPMDGVRPHASLALDGSNLYVAGYNEVLRYAFGAEPSSLPAPGSNYDGSEWFADQVEGRPAAELTTNGRAVAAGIHGARLYLAGHSPSTAQVLRVLAFARGGDGSLGAIAADQSGAPSSGNSPQGALAVRADVGQGYVAMGTGGVVHFPMSGALSLTTTGEPFGQTLAVEASAGAAWVLGERRLAFVDVSDARDLNPLAQHGGLSLVNDNGLTGAMGRFGTRVVLLRADETGMGFQVAEALDDATVALPGHSLDSLILPFSDEADFVLDSLASFGTQLWVSYYAGGSFRLWNSDQGEVMSFADFKTRGEAPSHDCIAVTDRTMSFCSGADRENQLRITTCFRSPDGLITTSSVGGNQVPDCTDNIVTTPRPEAANLTIAGDVLSVAADTVQNFRLTFDGTQSGLTPLGDINIQDAFKAVGLAAEMVAVTTSREFSMPVFENEDHVTYDLRGTLKGLAPRDMAVIGHDVLLAAGNRGLVSVALADPQTFVPAGTVPGVRSSKLAVLGQYLVGTDPESVFMSIDMAAPNPGPRRVQGGAVVDVEASTDGYVAVLFDQGGARNLMKLFETGSGGPVPIGVVQTAQPVRALAADNERRIWTVENDDKIYAYDFSDPLDVTRSAAQGTLSFGVEDIEIWQLDAADPVRILGTGDKNLFSFREGANPAIVTPANISARCTEIALAKHSNATSITAMVWCDGNKLHYCKAEYGGTPPGLSCFGGDRYVQLGAGPSSDGNKLAGALTSNTGAGVVLVNDFGTLRAYGIAADFPAEIASFDLPGELATKLVSLSGNNDAAGDAISFLGTNDGRVIPVTTSSDRLSLGPASTAARHAVERLRVAGAAGLMFAADVEGLGAHYATFGTPQLGRTGWLGPASGIGLFGNRVITVHPGHGVVLTDVSELGGGERVLGESILPSARTLAGDGHLFFVGTSDGQVRRYDATYSNNLVLDATHTWSGSITALAVAQGLVYAGNDDGGLKLLSYRSASGLAEGANATCTPGVPVDFVAVMGDTVITGSEGSNRLVLMSSVIFEPWGLTCSGSATTVFGKVRAMRSSGPYLYLSTGDGPTNGVEVWRLGDDGALRLVSASPTTTAKSDVLPAGDFVYAPPYTGSGMQIFEVE